jgi:hypothetical protein
MQRHKFVFAALVISLFLCAAASAAANKDEYDVTVLTISQNQTFMEGVGQNNIFETTPQQSKQVGYLSRLTGIDNIFSGSTKDETTADFTFLNDVVRTQVSANGPMRMVQRDGTFTLYRNSAPAGFTNLSSFTSGTLVLTGTSHQQVVLDTSSSTFSVYTDIATTLSTAFSLDGNSYQLGRAGDTFRIFILWPFGCHGYSSGLVWRICGRHRKGEALIRC